MAGLTRAPVRDEPFAVPPSPFRALVVDQHPLVQLGLLTHLRTVGASDVTLWDPVDALDGRQPAGPGPDVTLVGLAPQDPAAVALLAVLVRRDDGPVVALSSATDAYTVRSAFGVGARAYVTTAASLTTVTECLCSVLRGKIFVDPQVAAVLAEDVVRRGADGPTHAMTEREVAIVRLVAEGCSNNEIAVALGLSPATVKNHLANVSKKIGSGDRAQIVAMAMRAGHIY